VPATTALYAPNTARRASAALPWEFGVRPLGGAVDEGGGVVSELPGVLASQLGSLVSRPATAPALADALAELNAAVTADEVAAVAVTHARRLSRARASALAMLTAARTELAITGSVGYDCDAMAIGTRLPVDAGLPVTDAARTGTTVVRGNANGGWIAVPLGADRARPLGALLVSVRDANLDDVDVGLLDELAGHVRQALLRAPAGYDVASAARTTAPHPQADGERQATASRVGGVEVAVRSDPLHAGAGGDLVEVAADGAGGLWLVVADACGSDVVAHRAVEILRIGLRAVARHVRAPDRLLDELDELLRGEPVDRYVTALAVHAGRPTAGLGVTLTLASAGHPMPMLVSPDGTELLDAGTTGLPLNLRLAEPVGAAVREIHLAPGQGLLGYTDGLVDRRNRSLPEDVVADMCQRVIGLAEPADLLDIVFDVLAASQGPVRDDAAAALLRPLG
jgi:hypothetical protein